MIDDYYDYQWRQALEPLYEQFQHWKAGELPHDEMENAVHKTPKFGRLLNDFIWTNQNPSAHSSAKNLKPFSKDISF